MIWYGTGQLVQESVHLQKLNPAITQIVLLASILFRFMRYGMMNRSECRDYVLFVKRNHTPTFGKSLKDKTKSEL